MKNKRRKIIIFINILLLIISILISMRLLNKEDPRIYILIYWLINMLKTGIFAINSGKKTLIFATISSFFAACLLLFSHTPWPMILLFWIFIHLTTFEKVPLIDRFFMHVLFILAITVNLTEMFNIDPWFMMSIYWITTAIRTPNLLKWQR